MDRTSSIVFFFSLMTFHICQGQKSNDKGHKDIESLPYHIVDFQGRDLCRIYHPDGSKTEFRKSPKKKNYNNDNNAYLYLGGFDWIDPNRLLASQWIETIGEGRIVTDIVILNLNGKLIENLTKNPKYTSTSAMKLSKTGKLLLYTDYELTKFKNYGSPTKEEIYRSFFPIVDLRVMNLETREDAILISDFYQGGMRSFCHSPWCADEKRFIYTQKAKPSIGLEGEPLHDDTLGREGTYVYDITQKRVVDSISGSSWATSHPDSNILAYVRDNQVLLYRMDSREHFPFLSGNKDLQLLRVYFTPDAKCLYVQCLFKGRYDEKLYDLVSGNELRFKKPNLPNRYFAWRK